MSTNPHYDDAIDDLVNPALKKLAEMSDMEFQAYLDQHLSGMARRVLKVAAMEQKALEQDPTRKQALERLRELL